MSENTQVKNKIKILVTGAGGQLGQELAQLKTEHANIIGMSRAELDISDQRQCSSIIGSLKPDVVLHAGAYTAVDQAESQPDMAWRINVEGTRNVAIAAESVGAKLCYISTDYVFDGFSQQPYGEYDSTNPRTVYGHTKREGELAAIANNSRLFIVRTSWLYGRYGNNFVRTMIQLGKSNRELSVVDDQIGAPTYTYDLAKFLVELVQTDKYGTYHASNSGFCSWYQFAKAIFEEARMDEVIVNPCTTEQFPRPAPRPAYSVLGHTAMVDAGFAPLRIWHMALKDFIESMDQ